MPKKCFVIMPFENRLDEVFFKVISPTVTDSGYEIIRADLDNRSSNIIIKIIKTIADSDIIIADLSFQNANVFYELGIAHTLGKKVIMISNRQTDLPFDIKAYRVIFYKQDFYGAFELANQIKSILRDFDQWASSSTNPVIDSGVLGESSFNFKTIYAKNGVSPVVIETYPKAGDEYVDWSVEEIWIRFNKQMDTTGFSLCYEQGGVSFPELQENEYPTFSEDKTIVKQKVKLLPNKKYVIWINLPPDYLCFTDLEGNKAIPYMLSFTTRVA